MAETITVNNFFKGSGTVVGASVTELNCEIKLSDSCYLLGEIKITPVRNNSLTGTVEIMKMTPNVEKIYTDYDTYVTDKNKYYNYNAATSIKQGVYENYNYRSFIQFDKIVEYEKYSKTAASANIVLFPIDGFNGTIRIYESDYPIKDKNVTWQAHPYKTKLLAEQTVSVGNDESIRVDVTDFIKSVLKKEEEHKTFYIETDGYLNAYSSNTLDTLNRPYLELQYYDPDKLLNTNYLPAEINLTPVSVLPAELDLELAYPILDSEILFSKGFLDCEIKYVNASILPAELNMVFREENAIMSEIPYSKNFLSSEVKLLVDNVLDAELELRLRENVKLDAEISIIPVSVLPAELEFKYASYVDAELTLKKPQSDSLLTEISYSKNFLDAEMKVIPIGESKLDSEILFKSTGNESALSAEVLTFKPYLNSEMYIKHKSMLDAEIGILSVSSLPAEILYGINDKTIIPVEMMLIFNGSNDINAELNLLFSDKLDSEILFKSTGNVSSLPAELIVAVNGESSLDSEILYKAIDESILPTELNLMFNKESSLNAEILYKTEIESGLDAELNLMFKDSRLLDSELILKLNKESTLASEILFKSTGNESLLNCQLLLGFDNGYEELDCEIMLSFSNTNVHFYVVRKQ